MYPTIHSTFDMEVQKGSTDSTFCRHPLLDKQGLGTSANSQGQLKNSTTRIMFSDKSLDHSSKPA